MPIFPQNIRRKNSKKIWNARFPATNALRLSLITMKKYDGHFPLWVAVELFSFGMLSRFYSDMKTEDKKQLARRLYGTVPKNVSSWLRCCTDLRNICAHYGRLYYRIFSSNSCRYRDENAAAIAALGRCSCVEAVVPERYDMEWRNSFRNISID